jgi:hypothetical protein
LEDFLADTTNIAKTTGRPICVVGMHRSGTSMVSRLLDLCGVYFGPAKDLQAGDGFNPEGYWENLHFQALNERLLNWSGADWDFPAPYGPPPQIAAAKARAAELVAELAGRGVWGWKDPRTSLTLPFWKDLLPGLRAVVCLRNPLEVADSLVRRNWHSRTFGLNLWLTYNRRILETMPPEARVVTHYDSWFVDPAAELRRIAGKLGLAVTDLQIAEAAVTVKREHRHHRSSAQDLAEVSITGEVFALYQSLCEEASWNDDLRGRAQPVPRANGVWQSRQPMRLDFAALELEQLRAVNQQLWQRVETQAAELRAEAELRLETARTERDRLLQDKDRLLQAKNDELRALAGQLEARTAALSAAAAESAGELARLRRDWEQVRSGLGFPVLEELWKWRARLLPPGSLRGQALSAVKSKLRPS